MGHTMDEERVIKFIRKKDLVFVKTLGQGACGETVLLRDDTINEYFVCKKYSPYDSEQKVELFNNFVQEVKILHLLYHKNIVRVFNHYLYPSRYLGFIVMEYVDGDDIEKYLGEHPENINDIFLQVIEGFTYLENCKILHRDIRPLNILVSQDGLVKIIDFGFGKRIIYKEDFDKSISLNPWCEPPNEFNDRIYNFTTEIYFIGKLFEKIIKEKDIESFKYTKLLSKMCRKNNSERISKFFDVKKEILSDRFLEIEFSGDERLAYQEFSHWLFSAIQKFLKGSKYYDDIDNIQSKLESIYKNVMLEEYIPNNTTLTKCFVNGGYMFFPTIKIPVGALKDFVILLRQSTKEKKNIIISNLHSRLDAIPRYEQKADDDIPF